MGKTAVMLRTVLLHKVLAMFVVSCTYFPPEKDGKYLVVLSVDGFRHDYPEMYAVPNLERISERGVRAEYVSPVFPTFTFPNHYSMVTGMYPDNHGIVMNNFYCPELDATFRMRDADATTNPDFYGAEPVWVTAELQGITTATYYWVGSEAPVNGVMPTYWKEYDASVPFESRIDSVIAWLSLPFEDRPQLILFYFNEPDSQGHLSGPESKETGYMAEYIDSLVGVLETKLATLPFSENIDLIITSDHGMSKVSHSRYVNLLDHIEWYWFERFHGSNPVYTISPRQRFADTLYNSLLHAENVSISLNHELPERLNFGKNPRTLDMTVMADSSWSIGFGEPGTYHTGGAHGYDNRNSDMHTVFFASGPSFKRGHLHPPFEVIDLYPLIARILGITPLPSDACEKRISGMLKENRE